MSLIKMVTALKNQYSPAQKGPGDQLTRMAGNHGIRKTVKFPIGPDRRFLDVVREGAQTRTEDDSQIKGRLTLFCYDGLLDLRGERTYLFDGLG